LCYKEIKIFKKFDFCSYPPAHLIGFQPRIVRIYYHEDHEENLKFNHGFHGLRGFFRPALASLSESLFDASIYRSFVHSRRAILQCPICEAGEKGVLLATNTLGTSTLGTSFADYAEFGFPATEDTEKKIKN